VEDKYFLRITAEDKDRGLQAIVLEVDPEKIDIGTSIIRMISGSITNVIGIQQIIEDDEGVTHIKEANLNRQKKIFNALLEAASVPATDEQVSAMKEKISEVFDIDSEEEIDE
tara:strand:+ start:766 stop:1104 length:339 start_codon:yes stop_codon:yes gene_type:complete